MMKNQEYNIKIKDKEIPIRIRSYKNSRNIKAYFKGDTLYLSKPIRCSEKEAFKLIENNQDNISRCCKSSHITVIIIDNKDYLKTKNQTT